MSEELGMHLYSILILVGLLCGVLLSRDKQGGNDHYIIFLLFLAMAKVLSYAGYSCFITAGRATGAVRFLCVGRVAGCLFVLALTRLIASGIREGDKVSGVLTTVVTVMCLLGAAVSLLDIWFPIFYRFEGELISIAGWIVWIWVVTVAACFLLGAVLVLGRKYRTPAQEGMLLGFLLAPLVLALLRGLRVSRPEIYSVGMTLAVLWAYLAFHVLKKQEYEREEKRVAEARVRSMLSQIQPHFLYNTLEGIGYLCHVDPPKAEMAVTRFSEYLRTNMDAISREGLTTFNEELSHVKCYLELEMLRFDDRLKVKFDIQTTDFFLPPLSLQPLVENAVRHGVTKRMEGGTVEISTLDMGAEIRVIVRDDGVGFDTNAPREGTHVGIANVSDRVAWQTGGVVVIKSVPGTGTTAVIIIPKNKRKKKEGRK